MANAKDIPEEDEEPVTKTVVKALRPFTFNIAAAPAKMVFRAIEEDYPPDELKALLKNVDPKYQDEDGCSFMHAAAGRGSLRTLAVLINAGFDMHLKIQGVTPLMVALSQYNRQDAAEMLAKADPDLSQHTYEGITPVHLAAEKYDADRVLEVLLERGMDPAAKDDKGKTPLYYALKSKYETAFLLCNAGGYRAEDRAMLDEGIATQTKTYGFDYDWTLLLDYAAKKDGKALNAALPKKAAQLPRELDEATEKFFKEVRGHGSSFRFEKCYNDHTGLDYRDYNDMTPLMAGIESKTGSDMWAVRDLRWGSDPAAVDDSGRTILHYLVHHTDSPASSIFENMGWQADLDKRDNFGRTALMATMRGGNFIGELMEAGANPHITDNLGLSAMDYGKLYKSSYCTDHLAEDMVKHGWVEEEEVEEAPKPARKKRSKAKAKGFGV